MAVPYTFGTATASIPLSQLDSNFSTAITLGNTSIQLGNTVSTLNNMTLANVTISSGNITLTNVSATTANVTTANVVTLIVTGNETVQGNITVTGTVTAAKLIPTGNSATGNGMYLPATNAVGISTNGTNAVYIDASQNVGIGTASPAVKLAISSTDAILFPVGSTAQRPSGATGYMRFNSDSTSFEGYNGTSWTSVGGGATGGGSDQIFIQNGQTVTTNYTITTNYNAGTFGPVSINSGVTVTVPTGSVWTVI